MARIALFGSSYIARLEEFCWGDLKVPGDVRFFGIGGMKFETCAETLKKVKSFKPGAVYIFLGGNSITKNTKPSELADLYFTIIKDLRDSGVRKIYVAEIPTRGKFKTPGLDKKCFDSQREKINKLLRKEYGNDLIVFKDIKYLRDYDTDRVHYNDRGMQKFFYNIRRVLLSFKNV